VGLVKLKAVFPQGLKPLFPPERQQQIPCEDDSQKNNSKSKSEKQVLRCAQDDNSIKGNKEGKGKYLVECGQQAHLLVDGSHDFSDLGEFEGEP